MPQCPRGERHIVTAPGTSAPPKGSRNAENRICAGVCQMALFTQVCPLQVLFESRQFRAGPDLHAPDGVRDTRLVVGLVAAGHSHQEGEEAEPMGSACLWRSPMACRLGLALLLAAATVARPNTPLTITVHPGARQTFQGFGASFV